MKVKTISRSELEYTRERPTDLAKVHKNVDPALHPFEKAREYTRALNAVKLEKMFAKPFVGALSGHSDGIYCMARHPTVVGCMLSGACDGELRVWNMSFKSTTWNVRAHQGFVRGLAVTPGGDSVLSCGEDKTVKLWRFDPTRAVIGHELGEASLLESRHALDPELDAKLPVATWQGKAPFTAVDHQRLSTRVATSGSDVLIWDRSRSSVVQRFDWGHDTTLTVRFNPAETDLLAATATDRSVQLFDLRGNTPIKKLILEMKSNALAFNPMEPFNFVVANEDHCLFTFDMRKLDRAKVVHKDHVGPVLDVDFSPTGREFCSGSYDRTVRLWNVQDGKSREVYHTRRMQKLFSVRFSGDGRFVLTGSDDTNIRIWKAQASLPLGVVLPRAKQKIDYLHSVKERYKFVPEIRRIDRHRQLPKVIMKAKKLQMIMKASRQRKLGNRIKHSKAGTVAVPQERSKHIVGTES